MPTTVVPHKRMNILIPSLAVPIDNALEKQ